MTNRGVPSTSAREPSRQGVRAKRSGAVLAALWILATAAMGATLSLGARNQILGVPVGFAFIAALIWHLSRTGPPAADLPDLAPIALPRLSFRGVLGVIVASLGLLFAIGIVAHPWIVLVLALTLIALWIIIAWRHQVSKRLVTLGLAAGLTAGLASLIKDVESGDIFWTTFNLVTVPPLFVGGGLLLEHTGLARIRLLEGKHSQGVRSFLWACVLALPPALLNILGGAQADDLWIDRWWEPLAAWLPGIAEETWARLFLTTFCYALLRPTTNDRPRRAVAAAVLIGALTHGLVHIPTSGILSPAVIGALVAGLTYGVPMGLLFVKRDLEHAVGYHFFIDLVRFLAALFRL